MRMRPSGGLRWICVGSGPDLGVALDPMGAATLRQASNSPHAIPTYKKIGGRQRESNLPGNGCRPQPGLKPGRATGRDCLP